MESFYHRGSRTLNFFVVPDGRCEHETAHVFTNLVYDGLPCPPFPFGLGAPSTPHAVGGARKAPNTQLPLWGLWKVSSSFWRPSRHRYRHLLRKQSPWTFRAPGSRWIEWFHGKGELAHPRDEATCRAGPSGTALKHPRGRAGPPLLQLLRAGKACRSGARGWLIAVGSARCMRRVVRVEERDYRRRFSGF